LAVVRSMALAMMCRRDGETRIELGPGGKRSGGPVSEVRCGANVRKLYAISRHLHMFTGLYMSTNS
jgi:hypothetical protein